MRTITIRNKNALLELIRSGARFEKVSIVPDQEMQADTKQIISEAKKRGIHIEETPYKKMAKSRSGDAREFITGFLIAEETKSLSGLIDEIYRRDETPFFVLINRVDFPTNIGVIARTAFAAGVNGLIFQGDEREFFNDDTLHFSLGAIARIPLVKSNIFEALETLRKEGIPSYSLEMKGEMYSKVDLTGPAAFVLGAEAEGLSETVAKRCDKHLSIPMKDGIDSLNVGVSAAIILYEKVRQDLAHQ